MKAVALGVLRMRKLLNALKTASGRRAARLGVFQSIELSEVMPASPIDVVVDVGANRGQFALLSRAYFPESRLVCFEPGSAAYECLERVVGGYPEVRLVQAGLGSGSDQRELLVAADDDSSSFLPPTRRQLQSAPRSRIDRVEVVKVLRGDALLSSEDLAGTTLLKLDVQGSELDVLEGFRMVIAKIDYVLVELSLRTLYEGQDDAATVIAWLRNEGFRIDKLAKPAAHAGEQLQVDCLLKRH